jgi:hypothetical protein
MLNEKNTCTVYFNNSIPSKKTPNFDRVFMENIFLLHNFVR